MYCEPEWLWTVAFQIWVIVAAKLNCKIQLVIGEEPVLVSVITGRNPLFHDETTMNDAVALIVAVRRRQHGDARRAGDASARGLHRSRSLAAFGAV